MTDPERISQRSTGLSALLLRAGADEQPSPAGMQQTLVALGVAGAVLTTTTTASAALGSAQVTSALSSGAGASATAAGATGAGATAAAKVVSATLIFKWISIGVVGGAGLAGAAAVVTRPAASERAALTIPSRLRVVAATPVSSAVTSPPEAVVATAPSADAPPLAAAPVARVSPGAPVVASPEVDVGAPLAEEVALVDRARALLTAGQANQGLALLQSYEQRFPEARLLPEVLFLQLETCDRLGRESEARRAAQRLLEGFPKSPHATRARKLLAR